MVAPSSISPRLATEFFEAVREYVRSALGHPDQPLLAIDDAHKHLKRELSTDPTYATAAHCFLELIEAKRERIENLNRARDDE
jgi:hypothetical protein